MLKWLRDLLTIEVRGIPDPRQWKYADEVKKLAALSDEEWRAIVQREHEALTRLLGPF